ncbi:MAG: hypothetical protein IT304_10580 [Dehalococcoidia bacterium]|nr:hypothetical protein [Dehalococcoidia bacterium]
MHDQQELTSDVADDLAVWTQALTPAARHAARLLERRTPPALDDEGLAVTMGLALWFGPMALAAPWLFWAGLWRALLGSCPAATGYSGDVSRSLPAAP